MLWQQLNQTVELGWDFYLPVIMFVCYIGLIFYFRSRGGYKVVVLDSKQPNAP